MSIERDLISKILHERDLSVVSDAGITPAFFQSSDHRDKFRYILDHQRNYSQVPSIEAFLRNFPTYKIADCDDPLQYYVDEVVADYESFLLEDGLIKASDLFESGEIQEAKNVIAATLSQVNQQVNKVRAVDITTTTEERKARYQEYAKVSGALKGVSTGFSKIDAVTGGMQPGQLFTFVGPPKAGKSTMALLSALYAHMCFYRPLFIGFEMSNEEQEERHDAIRAGISHNKLRDGKLSGEDFAALQKMYNRMTALEPMIFTADVTATSTMNGISALVDKYKPNVLYIDGMYLMDDENGEPKGSPQALTNLTRATKRLAQIRNIPVAVTTQVLSWKMDRKRGVTTQSIGYTSSFAQDSDVLIGVEPTDDETVNKVKILDGRNVKKMEMYNRWDWDNGTFVELDDLEEVESDEEAATRF